MNTYLMKKAMIETAVSRGIREMQEDPERSVRRLVDLGRQFSKNRFQGQVFSVMQELLDNENSAYYDMVHNLLKNSDHDALLQFGVNYGYMSWAYGADRIRKAESESHACIPWNIKLRYDPTGEEGLTCERMAHLMEQGQDLGIYVYFIREIHSADSYAMLELLERYKDCAFIWVKDNGRLTAAQTQMLRMCKNTLVALPVEDDESMLTAGLLRDQQIPFAMTITYHDEDDREQLHHYTENVLATETAIGFLLAEDGASFHAGDIAYQSRIDQKYPFVVIDYYDDDAAIARILCDHENTLEIDTDGTVLRPAAAAGTAFPFDQDLMETFRQIMPAYQEQGK